jgi:hypothetical protein
MMSHAVVAAAAAAAAAIELFDRAGAVVVPPRVRHPLCTRQDNLWHSVTITTHCLLLLLLLQPSSALTVLEQ